MTHPSDLLERYALGQLPTPTLVAIDNHLEQCPQCLALLTPPPEIDLDTVWAAISTQLETGEALPTPREAGTEAGPEAAPAPGPDAVHDPAPDIDQRRHGRRGEPRRRISWLRRPVAVFAAAAVAVLSVIGGLAWLLAPADTPPPPPVTDPPTTLTTTTLPPPNTLPPPDALGRITTIVSDGDVELVGANPSLVVGADGLPMVMYTVGEEIVDSSGGTELFRPELVRCLDTACSQSISNEVAVPGFHNTLAIAPDGLPVIAHHDMDRVMLTRCEDASCTATSTVELAAASFITVEPVAVAFDQGGAPIVAFPNSTDYYIHVAACNDAACTSWSSGRVETFADADNSRWSTNTVDIVVPGDGLPVIAASQRDGAIHVAKCTDRACTESTATILDDTGHDTLTADMALGSDDLPLAAYYADGDLRVAKCLNEFCSDFTINIVGDGVAEFIASVAPSITIDGAGLPAIAYWAPGKVITLARCLDLACADATVATFGQENSFALAFGADGLPLLAHLDHLTLSELVVTKCSDATCGAAG